MPQLSPLNRWIHNKARMTQWLVKTAKLSGIAASGITEIRQSTKLALVRDEAARISRRIFGNPAERLIKQAEEPIENVE